MRVSAVDATIDSFQTELLVVGVSSEQVPEQLKPIDDKLEGALGKAFKEVRDREQPFRLVSTSGKLPAKDILLLGLGEEINLEALRRVSGQAAKLARDVCGLTTFATVLHETTIPGTSVEERAQAVTEGVLLGSYQFLKYRTVDREKIKQLGDITLLGKGLDGAVERGTVLAECQNLVRDLANESPSVLTPEKLAEVAKETEKFGVKVTVYDKAKIEELGLTALLAVNRGSVQEPRFVIMKYNGGGSKKVALVGKGITFDSGGLDLKPPEAMLTMKHDMCGAGAVLGAVRALAMLKAKVNVVGVFAATDNMPGMDAYKPGDVVPTYSGKTIEVANTDAEGRVILADALAYTERKLTPDVMIDLATLTGACVVALGSVCAGVMGTDDSTIKRLIDSGNKTGERVWQLPFFREYHEQVKSDIADVRNLGQFRRESGAITAGTFLAAFVEKTPWAHIDIAGTSWSDREYGYTVKNGTGYGVRLLVHALESMQ